MHVSSTLSYIIILCNHEILYNLHESDNDCQVKKYLLIKPYPPSPIAISVPYFMSGHADLLQPQYSSTIL